MKYDIHTYSDEYEKEISEERTAVIKFCLDESRSDIVIELLDTKQSIRINIDQKVDEHSLHMFSDLVIHAFERCINKVLTEKIGLW